MENKVNCNDCIFFEMCVLKNLVDICEYFRIYDTKKRQ